MVWGDLYDALATGLVDGTKASVTHIVPPNMHETLGFIVLDQHAYIFGFWWIGDAWLKSLPQDLQMLVVDGVRQAAAVQRQFNKYLDFVMTEKFVDAGGIVYQPTAEEKATFLVAKPAMKRWFIANVPDGGLWYNKLASAIQEAEAEIDKERARVLE